MFSDKIYRHFFSELSKHFLIILFALSAIVWAVQSVNFLDLIVEDGHSVVLYMKYSFLNVVKILTKFIPLSFASFSDSSISFSLYLKIIYLLKFIHYQILQKKITI